MGEDERLQGVFDELLALRWRPTPEGRIRIEAKEELRARLGRSPDRADAVSTEVLTRSTTLGVRMETVPRRVLSRSFEEVSTRWGNVRVKTGILGERIVSAEPEFEDCALIAREAGVPVKIVLQEARGKAMAFLRGEFRD